MLASRSVNQHSGMWRAALASRHSIADAPMLAAANMGTLPFDVGSRQLSVS